MENETHPSGEVGAQAAAGSAAPVAPPHPLLHRRMTEAERALEHALDRVWRVFRKSPYVGAGLAGGLGLALASFIGVGELAIGVGAAYAVYQMLRNRVPPAQALRDALKMEQGLGK